ncbi:zinc finger MYM-type protein 5-like [Bactrocera tryoni]|uniref:zinc finger MYM-type protein 5-like n=1 Tax=Bactrocera tryoni TaxID=59916 RepID=UPI001A96DBAB|nr:zinc finger MYM-type protein 5-like [Bactrocera tryoni]
MPPKKKLSGAQFKQIREEKKAAAVKNSGNIQQFFTRKLPSTQTAQSQSEDENDELNREQNMEVQCNDTLSETDSSNQHRVGQEEDSIEINFNNPKTWKIDKNSIKLYIEQGPINGDDISVYPVTNNRRFEKKWFTRIMTNGEKVHRNWLIYCEQLDSLFCFPCILFNDDRSSIWLNGFNDWQHWIENPYLPRHENSTSHRYNYIKIKTFEKKLKCGGFIDDHLLKEFDKERAKWRHILKVILDAIFHCVKNNDALRGSSEVIGRPDCGRFEHY